MVSDEAYQAVVQSARRRLAGMDREELVGFLQSEGLGFIHAVKAVRELTGISLGEAKEVVHRSAAYREDRPSRESFWADLRTDARSMAAEVQQPGTATAGAEPRSQPPDHTV